jgi:transposase
MIGLPAGTCVWLVAGITDMRCGFQGLAAKVQTALEENPLGGVAFRRKGAGCFRRNGASERRLIRGSNGYQESLFLPPFASADLLLSGIGRGTR